mgnify:CR=1 FL=1
MVKEYIKQYMNKFRPYKEGTWCYEDGILMNALYTLYQKTNNQEYLDFVIRYYDEMISENGIIKNYSLEEYNIDNIAPGIALFEVYQETKKEKYLLAIEELFKQLEKHPRTNEGNYWHKQRYPFQVWLDGIYMGQVFLRKYALLTGNPEILEDISAQLRNIRKYLFNKDLELYLHAYDEKKVMQWADKVTGRSPNVWSRSVGWLAMALVEMLDIKYDDEIHIMFKEMIKGIDPYKQDGMWLQIVDRPDVEGNYHETSGTMMLCYSYLKGMRLGLLKRYFYQDEFGYHLGGICQVAGLDNQRRDGSIAYYLSEKIKNDEVKGVAPFILAYSEII